ncbi:MAG: M13 family metallopeptidase [Deltaproteobacteria bacterium]|nr:M13 family metallopeptidase [Deltaproteobacteria bacterium]
MRLAPVIVLAAACGGGKPAPTSPTPAPAPAPDKKEPAPEPVATAPEAPAKPTKPVTNMTLAAIGLDPEGIDRSADPCEDFYQFSCGGWIAKAQIPADKPSTMRSFVAIYDRNLEYEKGVLEAAQKNPGKDPLLQKVGGYYGSCMDEAAIEKVGLKPLRPIFNVIDAVKDPKTLSHAVGVLHAQGYGVLFDMSATVDSADAKKMIAGIDQGGLGLPDRDYYLEADKKPLLDEYQSLVADLLVIAGHRPVAAKDEAAAIVALETGIAKVSKDKVARRDPKGTYNKIDREGVAKAMSHFDWADFWKQNGVKSNEVTVSSPEFLTGVDALLTSTKPDVWRNYLTVRVLAASRGTLGKTLEDRVFRFESKLTGQAELPPRWKRCVGRTEAALTDLVGQVFVRDKFPGASKSAAEEQVHAISAAMAANLDQLPWMDADTKKQAHHKLEAMAYQIGYPKTWKTYAFAIDPKDYAKNKLAAQKADHARDMAKIGRPVDREDWDISAALVNAFYSPDKNRMVFPAGILQPPFYSVDASIPVNMGAMGMVVGHELTHGFDDQGAQFDADGNLKDWWKPETEKQFKERTQCVIDQYSRYEVSGVKLNGANTVGENIADIGGIKLALTGMHALRASAPDTVVADGFTEDQQFFLAFGQAWCEKSRPEYEKLLATVDVHSSARWRVNGAVSDTPDFSKAFGCKAGAKMRPKNACVVW